MKANSLEVSRKEWQARRCDLSKKLARLPFLLLALSIASRPTLLPADAQSLADVAEKERQRRQPLGSASRVYTNADLNQYRDQSESSSRERRESKPSVMGDGSGMLEGEEEFVWSQRFIEAKREVLEVQTQSRRLQAKIRQANGRSVFADGLGYGTFEFEDQLKRVNEEAASAERHLEEVREQLRKSGKPASWESSLLALRSSSEPGESATPGSKDAHYWQAQLARIHAYYDRLIGPLKADPSCIGELGNSYPDDIRLLIQELNQKRDEEKAALAKQAFREGALPGWFR